MSFKLKTNTGTYRIWMRQRYVHVKSQRQLRELIQHNIDIYKNRNGWEGYAKSLQRKLDENKFHDIASLWGIFEKSVRIEDEKGRKIKC